MNITRTLQRNIVNYMKNNVGGNFTKEEIGQAFNAYSPSTIRTEMSRLEKAGVIVETGITARTSRGRFVKTFKLATQAA